MASTSAPAIQISRKGMFIWIGLIIFIFFWMFILGVMVGRGMAPVNLETDKLEKELAELKAGMLKKKREVAASKAEGETGEKSQLGFYEALKDPRKQTAFKPTKPVEPLKPEAAPPTPSAGVASAERAEPARPRPVPAPKPETQKPAVSHAADGPAGGNASTAGHFTIQVASVRDVGGAAKVVAELRRKGYQAYQIRSEVAGKGTWHRIRVGGFEDRHAAEKVLKKLKGDNYGGIVVSTQ